MAALNDLLVSYKQVEVPESQVTIDTPLDRYDRLLRYVNTRDAQTTEQVKPAEQPDDFIWYYSGSSQPRTQPADTSTISQTPTTAAVPTTTGSQEFEKAYDEVERLDPEAKNRRALLTQIAKAESGFVRDIQNKAGAPAYGYFQFMQGNYKGKNYNNIRTYAGTDINTFKGDAKLQIQAANKLAKSFMSSFSQNELDQMHKMGWTDNAIIAGAWLGGPNGVRSYVFNNKDRDDGATSISRRMQQFNFS